MVYKSFLCWWWLWNSRRGASQHVLGWRLHRQWRLQVFTTSCSQTATERLIKWCCSQFYQGGLYNTKSTIIPSAQGFIWQRRKAIVHQLLLFVKRCYTINLKPPDARSHSQHDSWTQGYCAPWVQLVQTNRLHWAFIMDGPSQYDIVFGQDFLLKIGLNAFFCPEQPIGSIKSYLCRKQDSGKIPSPCTLPLSLRWKLPQ
jgi:hypothetical protein